MATSVAGMSRDKAFCSGVLRYKAHHGPDFWSEQNVNELVELWNLTPEEVARLRDFQRRVADVDHFKNDPHMLIRFMRAPWGEKEAERMFRRMIQWRLDNNVDTILDDYVPPQVLLDGVASAVLRDYDRDGDPIYVERAGSIDHAGLSRIFTREELSRYAIWTRERNTNGIWINDYERRQGKHVRGVTIIFDLKGLNARHLTPKAIEQFKEHTKMTQEYFPGPIKRIIIIRAPKLFQVGWSLVKRFFPVTCQRKMMFLGSNDYLEAIEPHIDLNVLPRCIYEHGNGDTAIGMMQHLDGVESISAYLKAKYPSKDSTTTEDTDEDSVSSNPSFSTSVDGVTGKVLFRGSWTRTWKGSNVQLSETLS